MYMRVSGPMPQKKSKIKISTWIFKMQWEHKRIISASLWLGISLLYSKYVRRHEEVLRRTALERWGRDIFVRFIFIKSQMVVWPWFLTVTLIPLLNHPSERVPFGFGEMVPEHERDSLTRRSNLLEVSTDSKVDWAAQPIVSSCQAVSFSIKSACRGPAALRFSPD